MDNILNLKALVRNELIQVLNARYGISPAQKETDDLAIQKNLHSYLNNLWQLQWKMAGVQRVTFGLYAPIKNGFEPDVTIAGEELAFSWESAYPLLAGKESMSYALSKRSELRDSRFFEKLKEPVESAEIVVPDLILIPAVGFSRTGIRLGRGGGYFDRYLNSFQGVKIGICYSCQLKDEIPAEEHDEKVDAVITEKEVIDLKKFSSH